jgi:uncharacterized protein YdhG (YjbR/CyaY superfamily)
MKKNAAGSIDEYIAEIPKDVQKMLEQIRATVKKTAPNAEETIKYGIPTFTLNGNLIHFAGFAHHIGLYPTPSGIESFDKELSQYKQGKSSSVQFPLDQPLPLDLITRMVEFRAKKNTENAAKKKK